MYEMVYETLKMLFDSLTMPVALIEYFLLLTHSHKGKTRCKILY